MMLLAERSSARGVYNHNKLGENGDFESLRQNIAQTVSNRPWLLSTIIRKSHMVDLLWVFFTRGLHTHTAVERLPMR